MGFVDLDRDLAGAEAAPACVAPALALVWSPESMVVVAPLSVPFTTSEPPHP